MEAIRAVEKKYCSRAMMIAIFIGFGLILAGFRPIAKGLILGTFFSIVNFILMGEMLPNRITPSAKKRYGFAFTSILFRHLILAIPLYLGIQYDTYNLISVIFGLFMIQLMILGDHVSSLITKKSGKPLLWKS